MKPSSINVHRKSATLELKFPNNEAYTLPAEYLRVFSPSAEVQGHSPDQAMLQHGKRYVVFKDLEPQGHYALKIVFSDGHDSGIFSWDYLYELATNYESRWEGYLAKLQSEGKSREPQFIAVD